MEVITPRLSQLNHNITRFKHLLHSSPATKRQWFSRTPANNLFRNTADRYWKLGHASLQFRKVVSAQFGKALSAISSCHLNCCHVGH